MSAGRLTRSESRDCIAEKGLRVCDQNLHCTSNGSLALRRFHDSYSAGLRYNARQMSDDARFIPKAKTCIGLFLCLTLTLPVFGQEKRPQDTRKSCREFVESFYGWYLKAAARNDIGPAGDLALRNKPYLFSSELIRQIREDFEAQKRAGSDLVSLDGDPFIGADGPPERYVVEKITTTQDSCWADVHFVWDGEEVETPSVTPKMRFKDGRWRFVDFYFYSFSPSSAPKRWSLLTKLRELQKSRMKYRFSSGGNSNPK